VVRKTLATEEYSQKDTADIAGSSGNNGKLPS
jgi:hypothetical protein